MNLPLDSEKIIHIFNLVYTFFDAMAHIDLTPYFAYEGCRTGRLCGAQRLLKLIHWHLDVASRQDANTAIDKMEVQNHNIFRKKCIGTFLGNITIHEFITIFEMNVEKKQYMVKLSIYVILLL